MLELLLAFMMIQGVSSNDPLGALIEQTDSDFEDTKFIQCSGVHRQGSALFCQTIPNAQISLGDITVQADQSGWVVIGHDRDADPQTVLKVEADDVRYEIRVEVEQREYDIQRIEGVPQKYVTPPKDTLARIRSESREKASAYQSRWDKSGFATGFIMPVKGVITGVYGSQRFYNGEPRRPHYGIDIAAPNGTPVLSPAEGIVTLADEDMYYEGGLIFIDHGQGFTSAFLHLSGIDVSLGDIVEQGQHIGTVGAGGRSTGAHLDWRIKWHNRYIDPTEVVSLQLDHVQ